MTADIQVETGLPKRARLKVATPQQQSPYDAAVAEAKQILQNIETAESGRMRLGELADQVETHYGDEEKSLKKFAKDIGMALCTLERTRSVYRAWAEIKATPPNFSVAQELQKLPDRARIIEDKPNITVLQARKKRLEYDKQKKQREQNAPGFNKYKKWFTNTVEHANTVETDAEIVDDNLDSERRKILREAIEPNDLPDLRVGGNALIKLADFLERLLAEASSDEQSQAT
jgi:hypothetical protein